MFLSRNKKNNVYPANQFYYIKVGFKGVGGGSVLYCHVLLMIVTFPGYCHIFYFSCTLAPDEKGLF